MALQGNRQPMGYAKYTTTGSAFTLDTTPDVGVARPAKARSAIFCADTQKIRWTDDGTTPTTGASGNGHPMAVDSGWEYDGDLKAMKFIAHTAGAILHVAYYR